MIFYNVINHNHELKSQHSVLKSAQIECDMRTHDSRPPKLHHVTNDEGEIVYTSHTCYTLATAEAEVAAKRNDARMNYPLDAENVPVSEDDSVTLNGNNLSFRERTWAAVGEHVSYAWFPWILFAVAIGTIAILK